MTYLFMNLVFVQSMLVHGIFSAVHISAVYVRGPLFRQFPAGVVFGRVSSKNRSHVTELPPSVALYIGVNPFPMERHTAINTRKVVLKHECYKSLQGILFSLVFVHETPNLQHKMSM